MADVCDVYFCSALALPHSYFTGSENEIDWWQLWLYFDEGDSNGFHWYGCFFPFYFLILIEKNCYYHHFQLLYTVSSCDVSSVYIISASSLSHKHWEPGVSLWALSTLFCWVLYFVCCLASQPIAAKLNPISGSTISQAPWRPPTQSSFHLCKCQFMSTLWHLVSYSTKNNIQTCATVHCCYDAFFVFYPYSPESSNTKCLSVGISDLKHNTVCQARKHRTA